MTAHEEEFLSALRSVVIHLIKHDQPLYKPLTTIVEAADENRWAGQTPAEKAEAVALVQNSITALDAYYDQYPHGWSRARYTDLKVALPLFAEELGIAT